MLCTLGAKEQAYTHTYHPTCVLWCSAQCSFVASLSCKFEMLNEYLTGTVGRRWAIAMLLFVFRRMAGQAKAWSGGLSNLACHLYTTWHVLRGMLQHCTMGSTFN